MPTLGLTPAGPRGRPCREAELRVDGEAAMTGTSRSGADDPRVLA
jgi:hypothetical protein